MKNDTYFMDLALKLAASALGQTEPNPMVGAIIVMNGDVVGLGAHLKAGTPHAEIHALQMAKDKAQGATVYVTLEPCSHYGRTPPCADALIQSGVQKVVIATLDPNPVVSGNGVKKLREAGIEVIIGILEEESRRLNEVFNKYIVTKKPFVTMKTAMTLDGKIATHTGSSKWITGEEARKDVHQLRHRNQAILVGVNTVIADDPELTTRGILNGRNPIRVIVDSNLRIPLSAKVVSDQKAPTWIFTTEHCDKEKKSELEKRGVRVFITGQEHKVNLEQMLILLGAEHITSVLVEGGGMINGTFLKNGLVDKVVSYIAPKLVGGQSAPTPIGGEGVDEMGKAILLENIQLEAVGKDVRIIGYPIYNP